MEKIYPNKVEGFERDFTGLLSPEGDFYYSGRFGHDDLGSALVEQIYNKEIIWSR